MNKYFRKNGKKIMAILGVLLMIAFALPSATSNMRRTATDIGTLDHGKVKIDERDYNHYRNQWITLKRQFGLGALSAAMSGIDRIDERAFLEALGDPDISDLVALRQQDPMQFFTQMQRHPEIGSIVQAAIQNLPVVNAFENNEELFVILAKEAQVMGVGVNNDLVEAILSRRGYSRDVDPDQYEILQQALRTLLAVNNAAARAADVVKVSQPEIQNLLASMQQQIAANILEFNAADFLDKVPAPTPDQIKAQYEKYKDKEAGEGKLAFGYKYPNRVKFDAIIIKHDDVKKGAPPVQLDEVWEYFLRNKNTGEFVKSVPASTKPSDALDLRPPGPTTRPMTFDEAKQQIITRLSAQRADQLAEKIRDAVHNTIKADYEAFKLATQSNSATTAPTTTLTNVPPSSLGVPYNSYDYLKKLRDKIQADFKVTLTIQDQEAWQTPKTLEDSEIAKESFTNDSSIHLPLFLSHAVTSFFTADQLKQFATARPDSKPVAVWEPAPLFHNFSEDYLIARITAADPAHVPASLDQVKDTVAADVKLNAAYEKARQAAQAVLDAAKDKWLVAVAADQHKHVITTGLFTAAAADPRRGDSIPNYDIKPPALETFVQGAFKLLAIAPRTGQAPKPATMPATQPATQASTTKPTTKNIAIAPKPATHPTSAPVITSFKNHPIGLIELPDDAKILVTEIDQLIPTWNKQQVAAYETSISNQQRIQTEQILRARWFNFDATVARTNYTPTEKRDRKPATPQVPINPLVP